MKNETLFQNYKNLCTVSLDVAKQALGCKGLAFWQDRGSDAQMYRLLRGRSGIDEGTGFTDFTPDSLSPHFSAFISEALKDSKLSELYSDKDLGPIVIYQLTFHLRRLLYLMIFGGVSNEVLEETFVQIYAEFEGLLYERDWVTATIYPLVNFYSKTGWELRQQSAGAIDQRTIVYDETVFPIGDDFQIKQLSSIMTPLLDKSAETSPFRARSPYRDFTGDWFVLEARASTKKMPTLHNLTDYLIGNPLGFLMDDVNLEHRKIVNLPEYLLLALRLFKSGDIGIAPYRYISDYPRRLYVPDLYVQRQIELAQIEGYNKFPYILDSTEVSSVRKLYGIVSNLLSSKSPDLEHIDIAQRYFQYSYSYRLTDELRLQDRVVSLIFALEALLLKQKENYGTLARLGGILIGKILVENKQKSSKDVIENTYLKIRNSVAHGKNPVSRVTDVDVMCLERCVRCAIRRVIGLAVSQDVRSKEDLRHLIDKAEKRNKRNKDESGYQELRKIADDCFN